MDCVRAIIESMRRVRRPACFLLLACACIFFSGIVTAVTAEEADKAGSPKENAVTVGIEDSGKEIKLKKGDVVRIELRTFGTAGYMWYFDDLDRSYMELVSEETKPVSRLMGAPTLCVWRLKAGKAGKTKIIMSNYRVWEGREKAVGKFSLDITIE